MGSLIGILSLMILAESKRLKLRVPVGWRELVERQKQLTEILGVSGHEEKVVEFIKNELLKLSSDLNNYNFQTETMVRSKYFGLQGRIDRTLWNTSKDQFSIYETKTGKSSASSEESAKYQLISYSIIINEYYSNELHQLFLEYPRNLPKDRLFQRVSDRGH